MPQVTRDTQLANGHHAIASLILQRYSNIQLFAYTWNIIGENDARDTCRSYSMKP